MTKTLDEFIVFVKVIGELLFLFGFLGWVNGEIVQLTNPTGLSQPLSHLTPWIRVDTFAILSFIVSAVGFLMWRTAQELTSRNQK